MNHQLNLGTSYLVDGLLPFSDELRINVHELNCGGRVLDFGIEAAGSLQAGLELAKVCMSDLVAISLSPTEIEGISWQNVNVHSDAPVAACLLSQYAGWQISIEKYFAMGSGPMRVVAAIEELFEKLNYSEKAEQIVGVLETSQLPTDGVFEYLSEKTGVAVKDITLLVAPTASQAGNIQVVARSVETALHKLFELGFDVNRIKSGYGSAPLPPVAKDDLTGIGRTNDAILYGGRVTLWVTGDDESIAETGAKVPASSSDEYGKPFLQIFEDAGRDFYKIDPHLFSPAEIVFQNLDTGNVHRYGSVNHAVVRESFGI